MYVDHPTHYYRLFSPNCPLVVAVQCTSRQGHTHAARRTCVRVASRTRATHLSLTRTYALTYTTVHLPLQRYAAIPCRRTLGSPGRPYIEEATLFFSSSSFLGPADPPSCSVSGNTLSSAPRRARTFKSRRLFEKENRNREDFQFTRSRIEGSIA